MLSEILFASVNPVRQARPDRAPGISVSQLYPCPYRLLLVHEGRAFEGEIDPRSQLNMEDGWDQEEQSVKRLRRASIHIIDRQARVTIGNSTIPGQIDGTVVLQGKKHLWEHKAWDREPFHEFVSTGLSTYPGVKAQINGYMIGMKLDSTNVFVKCKGSNDYHDIIVGLDLDFIAPIIEWADKIRSEDWKPKPEECKYCAHCYSNCFGAILDFSKITELTAVEAVDKWIQGNYMSKVGEMMIEEARGHFLGIKDKYGSILVPPTINLTQDMHIVNGSKSKIEIKKIVQHRWNIDRYKIMQEFGPEGLLKVAEQKDIETFRFREV